MTPGIVTRLEVEPPLECLAIGHSRLGLDPCTPWRWCPPRHFRVPSPKIAFDRNGHLGPPPESRVNASAKPLEQGQLGPVPQRIASRIRPKRKVETNDRTVVGKKRKIRERNLAALQPADTRMGRANRATHFGLTEPGTDPCESHVIGHAAHSRPAAPPRALRHTFSRRHRGRSWHSPLCWRFTAVNGTLSVPTGEPATRSEAIHWFCPPVGTPGDPTDPRTHESGCPRPPRSLVGTARVQFAEREAPRMAEATRP
jgi:hypothetical protein